LAFSYILWFFVFLFVSYGLGRLYAPLRRNRFFKLCFAPGFLVLGGLKLLACSISGAEVGSVKFFAADREAVEFDHEDVSILGKVILAIFPLVGAFVIFALVAWAFSYPLGFSQNIDQEASALSFSEAVVHFGRMFALSLGEMLRATAGAFTEAGRGNLLPFVYLYLLISILLAMPPTTRELKYAAAGIVIICVAIWLVTWAGVRLSGRLREFREMLWLIFSFALALLTYVTAVTFFAITVAKLFQSLTSDRNRSGEVGA